MSESIIIHCFYFWCKIKINSFINKKLNLVLNEVSCYKLFTLHLLICFELIWLSPVTTLFCKNERGCYGNLEINEINCFLALECKNNSLDIIDSLNVLCWPYVCRWWTIPCTKFESESVLRNAYFCGTYSV